MGVVIETAVSNGRLEKYRPGEVCFAVSFLKDEGTDEAYCLFANWRDGAIICAHHRTNLETAQKMAIYMLEEVAKYKEMAEPCPD